MVDGKRMLLTITILSYIVTIISGITYLFTSNNVGLLTTLLLLLISSLLLCWNNIKYYLIHFIFFITIFIFLVSRPTIDYFRDGALDTYQPIAYRFAFLVVIVSILGLTIGGFIANYYLVRKSKAPVKVEKTVNVNYIKKLRFVSLSVFLLTYPFYFLRLFERLLYRLQTSYYNYYANFESQLPYFTYILSTFTVYAMCVYLATKPKKSHATMVLVAYIAANLIHLVIGTRNPFILSLIFAFVYYFMREQTEKGKWIGFKEKLAIYLGTPVLMLAMGALNYVRDNAQVSHSGVFDLLLDFIYKQGTSFGVLARGFLYNSSLPYRDFRNFTFGPVVDYFARGSIGIIFGAKPFEHTTNSIELAIDSNSYAHNLSYLVLNKEYLRGHGIGSSYIMELYTDYGMLGLFLLSILLGMLFIAMLQVAYRSRTILFALSLLILNNLFFMPRSSFSESFFSLFTMQFWGIVLIIIFVAKMLTKENHHLIKKGKYMFEHYSVADLFANLYKKRKVNLLALLALFALIAVPFTLKAVKNKNTVKDSTSYSTYITYKITAPETSSKTILNHQVGGYSDFYAKLIDGNLNGAFLFNDVDSDKMKEIAKDLDTTETALKNSASDYWTKKLTINPLIDDAGVTVKILTPSKEVNDFLESKFDSLIDKFKSTYTDVKIEKLETVNSKELTPNGEVALGFNLKNLILRLVIIGILCVILVIMANVLVYLFNPTINRAGDFSAYQVDFVSTITTLENLSELLSYKCQGQPLAIVSSDNRILNKLQAEYKLNLEGVQFVNLQNVKDLLAFENVLFVEEYGVTRYKKFEESMQEVRNLNRSVLGVITFAL